jgi:hypothetical protein
MSDPKSQKIVYLFGAGATHAEIANLEPNALEDTFLRERGLLIGHVSRRVIGIAQSKAEYLADIQMISGSNAPQNIELLISLIENSRIKESESKSRMLKTLVREDIEGILTTSVVEKFYLHRALLELHQHKSVKGKEKLLGLISLNYDSVLDNAYETIYNKQPNYSFVLTNAESNKSIPLLKLHGSFDWKNVTIRGRERSIDIIPLGASKNYLHLPYNFIWSRALEILIQCDVLRVIGCSLSQNDMHLIDLLFKAHIEKGKAIEIQIINLDSEGERLRSDYGFFPEIKPLTKIERTLVPETEPLNPFKMWLKYKGRSMLKEKEVKRTQYLRTVVD